uniref:HSF-type DNA-binding domain-containing protein n=1 Tax=Anopheles atroparvus TaxID=41427 RepID=A0AAG5DH26_ANOAO
MHTFSETGTGVPAFLAKLWRLVEDAETNDLISWSTDGRSFIIQNQAQFAKELLPLNYKHNNMASFIRQLNMYGFHKITSIDNGGLRFDRDEMEFTHPCFQKDHPYLLEHIKRKIATSKQQQLQAQQAADDKSALKLEAVSRVLSEVKNMRGRQDSLDSRFQAMKQENEALWREVAILRQKHHKQQQIVNKLIQFLVTIVQPSRGGLGSMGNGSNKRRFQLMINDAPQQAKLKKSDYSDGATIEELGEALEEVAYANQQELLSKQDKSDKKEIPVITAQLVRTSPSASTSASGTGVGKSAKTVSGITASLGGGGGRTIVKTLDGSSIIKKQKVLPSGKTTRNSEFPEVSSPMSFAERSPFHRTATPAMSTGGSSTRSSNGGNGSEAGDGGGGGGDSFEEVFLHMPQVRAAGGGTRGFIGSSLAGGRGLVKVEKQDQQEQRQQYVMRSMNTARGSNNSAPKNLAQLIENAVDGDELESYSDIVEQEEDQEENEDEEEAMDGLNEGADDDDDDRDAEQHGYLVDHVDEIIDPTIVQLYQDGEHDMMLNTPMVIREMEKQKQQQQKKDRQQGQQQVQLGTTGKKGDSLLKGGGVGVGSNKRNSGVGSAHTTGRSQKSLLTAASSKGAPGVGLKSCGSGTAPPVAMIVTRGGKKLAMVNATKKQVNVTGGEQQQQQQHQQGDGASPGPSGYQSAGSTNSPSPPIISSAAGPTFIAEGGGNSSSYVTASDILPGDIFEISNDQGSLSEEAGEAGGVMVKDTNPSPMLNGYSFIEGGYYNPNVNINNIKAGRQQQQQQQQQQGQQVESQPAQQSTSGTMLDGGTDEYDDNSLDSSMLQTPQGSGGNHQQQISKFVSADSDVSRLNTVAEYGQHIDTVQTDLESLKELLKGEGYQLDANALLGVSEGVKDGT